jgi:DNA processing protein
MNWPIKIIPLGDKNYPKMLSNIPDPPKQLYCRGNLDLLNKDCLSVVGTRKITSYGKESTQYITRDLVKAGFVIVSGLAMGIDAIAHQTVLDINGKTIAVLGGGVSDLTISPKINLSLARQILKNNGLIISEYSENQKIYPQNFAARNRIISGLSKGVIIVEADKNSGSLITAKCALDQGRDVFAVPGSIFSNKSTGVHDLIKNGAKLITSGKDVLEEYGYNLNIFENNRIKLFIENPIQKNILDILKEKGQSTEDEIISYLTSINISDIIASLSILEINGLIEKTNEGKYKII